MGQKLSRWGKSYLGEAKSTRWGKSYPGEAEVIEVGQAKVTRWVKVIRWGGQKLSGWGKSYLGEAKVIQVGQKSTRWGKSYQGRAKVHQVGKSYPGGTKVHQVGPKLDIKCVGSNFDILLLKLNSTAFFKLFIATCGSYCPLSNYRLVNKLKRIRRKPIIAQGSRRS